MLSSTPFFRNFFWFKIPKARRTRRNTKIWMLASTSITSTLERSKNSCWEGLWRCTGDLDGSYGMKLVLLHSLWRNKLRPERDYRKLGIEDSSSEIDALRDHFFLPSKYCAEAMFMKQLDHATAEWERLQLQRTAQDLPNEPKKAFEMNTPSNVVESWRK
jgi:hypothetical protein